MTRETVNRQSYSVSRQRPITNSMLAISAHKWGCTDNRYLPIIAYTLGKYKKRYEGSRLRRVESGLWTQFQVSRRLKFYCCCGSRRCTCQINTLKPSSHPGNRRPSICSIFARNLLSIDPAHAVYDAHPRRCTSHSMRRADPAKGSARKCNRSKVGIVWGVHWALKS